MDQYYEDVPLDLFGDTPRYVEKSPVEQLYLVCVSRNPRKVFEVSHDHDGTVVIRDKCLLFLTATGVIRAAFNAHSWLSFRRVK